jgi:hypothetical protein
MARRTLATGELTDSRGDWRRGPVIGDQAQAVAEQGVEVIFDQHLELPMD